MPAGGADGTRRLDAPPGGPARGGVGRLDARRGADAELDFRDDTVEPSSGQYLGLTLQFAGLGGDARDARVEPEARAYVPVTEDVTWASRAKVGFLFPFNYRTFTVSGDTPSVKDTQIAYFRAFFSGGPTQNRGYPYRAVGPHGAVPFFNPAIAQSLLQQSCEPDSVEFDDERCSLPLGGSSLWEASTDLRISLSGPFLTAVFCDASDVALERTSIVLSRPHLSCGIGPRYRTPVGVVRADVGYRVPGLQVLGETTRHEGDPGTIFGLPINVSLGLGEVY